MTIKITKNTPLDEVLARKCYQKALELLEAAEVRLLTQPEAGYYYAYVAGTYLDMAEQVTEIELRGLESGDLGVSHVAMIRQTAHVRQ